MNILSRILPYFAVDNEMKLFFLLLFFFINKKTTSLLQPTNLYKYVSISIIFPHSLYLTFSLLFFSQFFFLSPIQRE